MGHESMSEGKWRVVTDCGTVTVLGVGVMLAVGAMFWIAALFQPWEVGL